MKYKLIKLSDIHYIIVNDSEIKEGDWMFNYSGVKYNEQVVSQCTKNAAINWQQNMHINNETKSIRDCIKKITHSTQPLETKNEEYAWYGGENKITAKTFNKIKPLSLSEVEEAIYGYSVENAAYHFCDNVVHPKDETRSLYFAFCTGFKAHQELVKDKLFTIEDMRKELTSLALEIATEDGQLSSCSPSLIYSWIENKIKTLLPPKTEWDIKFDEQGKIKLI